MPCPSCFHTMQNLGLAGPGRTFWCPRCGTLKIEKADGFEDFESPKLVERVEKLLDSMWRQDKPLATETAIHVLGVAESVGKKP